MLVPAVFAVLMKMNLYLWDRIIAECCGSEGLHLTTLTSENCQSGARTRQRRSGERAERGREARSLPELACSEHAL